jgi:tRNA (adenine57-N1/adenine58-N1)-methyltransferase catalytic subunit
MEKILFEEKSGKKFFVKNISEDFHTSFGIISSKDLKSKKSKVTSSKGKKFQLFAPTFSDLRDNLKKGPQMIIHKDIGLILAKTGVNKHSKVVDAGGGSGSLCFSLANICKEVTVYEINPEHYKILSKNQNLFSFKNIEFKQESVYKGIKEKELDLITLDLPEPWQVVKHAEKSLVQGGYLVVYLPNLSQVKMFIDSCNCSSIKVIETLELIERKWKIEHLIMRPEFDMLGHTGFLTFCRKLG